MQGRPVVGVAAVVSIALGVLATGCGAHRSKTSMHLLTYRPGLPLHLRHVASRDEGTLHLEEITYTSVDGSRVPALFALPTDQAPHGCLVYQGGYGQTKEQFPQLRSGAAALGLATFTIDPRGAGARGSAATLRASLRTPEAVAETVVNTVVDLRVGLDYLEERPQCHHNIAYLGTSLGGLFGVRLAAQDRRINSVVLTSLSASLKEAMLVTAEAAQGNSGSPVIVPGAATDPALLSRAARLLSPYDPAKWIGKIAPRPLLLIDGRFDPLVAPVDFLELAAAARPPKTVLYFDGGHDPFAPGPDQRTVAAEIDSFLSRTLHLRSHR